MIWSIKYKPTQITEWNPYLNIVRTVEEKSYLFEHGVILKLRDQIRPDEWTGFLSHKFPEKTLMFKSKVEFLLKREHRGIISFCKEIPNYLKWTETQHPGFLSLFTKVCNDLDISTREPSMSIYGSFWLAKGHLYLRYIDNCLIPAINLLETKYKEEAWQDSTYEGLDKKELKLRTGLDYYPLLPFVLERLVGNWANTNQIHITNYGQTF